MQIKAPSICPCSLLCSLTAVPLHSVSRVTAATPKQVSWNRSAWRRSRIRGERNKLTEAVDQNLCIIAELGAAYHSYAYINTSTKYSVTPNGLFSFNTRSFHSTTRNYLPTFKIIPSSWHRLVSDFNLFSFLEWRGVYRWNNHSMFVCLNHPSHFWSFREDCIKLRMKLMPLAKTITP